MADKYIEHAFCYGEGQSGLVIHCPADKGDVVISWSIPEINHMNLSEIVPPITDWNVKDGVMYEIGKIVYEHFLTEDKDQ